MFHEVGITVEEILSLAEFKNVKVVGGRQGLGRVVTNVNVMEVPDILDWIREGDLLLTTGYAIRDDLKAQRELVPKLAAKGLAALAFKPKRYIDTVPSYMVEAANSCGLPLLELPYEVSFSDLMSAVLAQIVNRQARFLRRSMGVHRQFANLILEGGSLKQMGNALAKLLKAVVLVEDTLNLRRELAGLNWAKGTETLALALLERPTELSVTETLRDKIEGPVMTFQRERVEAEGYQAELIRIPLVVGNEHYGCIKALKFDDSFSFLDLLNLERVCFFIALDVIRCHGIAQVEQKYKTEFLDQLLMSENISDEATFIARGRTFGWDLTLEYIVLLLNVLPVKKMKDLTQNERISQLVKSQAITLIDDFCRRNSLKHILTSHSSGILLGLHPQGAGQGESISWTQEMVKKLRQNLSRWSVTIGIGRPGKGIAGLKRSYYEARIALELGQIIFGPGQDIYYDNLGIYGLLLGQAGPEEQKRFALRIMGPLYEYDTFKGGELLKTLEVYIQTNCNIKRTAELLFTHYNTVLYRLTKIKQITGFDPDDPEQRLTLQAALRLFKIFNK
ncbi:PucR C-terminal helix-turn-helix domain-containing protein [Thermanaeromonas toyohensis ToBE]|uniref:PucR C-terminal helix-turn-helix domain-containing protein n=1 Tax=Thermanaeromonas toyohensis ToBE TaxID=698762 RepID=A0A1W1W2C8_9FIRM|nr:PucR family transcriptional regulator [Thermanaeromonas toyohensis]SMB99779.1 PucR C-terminal helix-turn-helix domain-containing protein [Thermanaeromonas toyohensis ToBE]